MKVFILLALVAVALAARPRPTIKPAIQLRRTNFHRVTNGRDAEPGEFPWQLSYQWGIFGLNQHVCGASILTPLHAVTAAHCIALIPTEGDHIAVAGINLLDAASSGQSVLATTRTVHPDYNPPESGVGPNDVAVLGFDTALVLGDLVQAIPLSTGGLDPLGTATLSGWGYTSTTGGTETPNALQTVDLVILPNQECTDDIQALLGEGEENPYVAGANICTGPVDEAKSACGGDSGGPLVLNGELTGIVSWGFNPCGYAGAPSVFTNVANYEDFINENTQ